MPTGFSATTGPPLYSTRGSIADGLRERTIAQVLALTVAERIALAFRLGDDDLALYVRASGLDGDEARRRLRARRQIGRTPSRSAALGRP